MTSEAVEAEGAHPRGRLAHQDFSRRAVDPRPARSTTGERPAREAGQAERSRGDES
jgi:hypothetical protein